MTVNGTRGGVHVTGVISARGGSGQSTVCLHWARALGETGARTLLLELAGGDMAARAGVAPRHFTEDVASGDARLDDAVVAIGTGVDLLASGNAWAVFGPPSDAVQHTLLEKLAGGTYQNWVVDFGRTRPHRHHPIWSICDRMAVVIDDDVAGMTRSYALLRHLLACGWARRLGVILNRTTDSAATQRLRRHLEQITRAFLHCTVPVIGELPEGNADQRSSIIRKWAQPATEGRTPAIRSTNRITSYALSADNTQ